MPSLSVSGLLKPNSFQTEEEMAQAIIKRDMDAIVKHWPLSKFDTHSHIQYVALSRDVLAVAVVDPNFPGEWKAYIGPVPGKCHDEEAHSVHRSGTRLSREVAQAVFRGQFTSSFTYVR